MATIGALLGRNPTPIAKQHSLLPAFGAVGIELELEGLTHWPDVTGWAKTPDGSLRDGIEYVFNGPQGGAQAVKSIKLMVAAMKEAKPDPSFRCSTHIHLDVRDLELSEFKRLVIAYTMMEGVMFDHCSLERRYSNFCTPYFLNTYLPRLFSRYARQEDQHSEARVIRNLSQWPKYSSLNLKPATEYGSVEFRGSHALLDEVELLGLAQRMLHLKRLVKEVRPDGTELQFIEAVRQMRVQDVFPTGFLIAAPDERLLDLGYASAIGIATNNVGMAEPQVAREPRPARREDPVLRLMPEAVEQYNMYTSGIRTSQYLKLIARMRNIQGIAPPSTYTFLGPDAVRIMGGAQVVLHHLEVLGLTPRQVGL